MFKRIIGCLRANFPACKCLRFSLLLWLLLSPQLAHRLNAQVATTLEVGASLERELSGGQTHRYQIKVAQGQQALISLEQRGIDAVVEVFAPDGGLIAEFDDELRSQGREEVVLVAETAQTYALNVTAKIKSAPTGRYEIRLTETRAASTTDRSLHEARKLQAQFNRLYRDGKHDEGRLLIERALALAESVLGAQHIYVARLALNLGGHHGAKRNPAKAKPLYERALAIAEKELGPEHPFTAFAALWLGAAHNNTNEIVKADKLLNRALEISEKQLGPEHPQVALCLVQLGLFYNGRGDSAKAEQLSLRAVAIKEKALETEDYNFSVLLNNLGVQYLSRRDYARAEQFYQRSLALKEKLRGLEDLELAIVLQNLGNIAREKKDYAAAEKYQRRALTIREKALGPGHPDVAMSWNNIANLYRAQGDLAKSLETHLRAFSILEKAVGPAQGFTITSLGNIAKTYAAMGDWANAVKFQARADAAIETNLALNLVVGSERQKIASISTVAERTDRTISLNLQSLPNDREAGALAALVILQRKGRVLDAMTETLATVRLRASLEDRLLLDQLNETTRQLARLVLNGPQQMSPEEHRRTVKDLEEKKERLEAEISRHITEFGAQARPVTVASVQSAIPNNAALVEFATYRPFNPKAESNNEAYGAPRYAAYVMRREGAPRGIDLGATAEIEVLIGELRQALRDPLRRDARELAHSLDEKLMRPVRALLADATELLVSPDGQLNLIPFEALVDERRRYLVERYAITYLTSGRDLLRLQTPRESGGQPVVLADPAFGEPAIVVSSAGAGRSADASGRTQFNYSQVFFGPLPGVGDEVRALKTLLPQATFLTREQATEATLKRVRAPSILHIATHGFFLENDSSIENPSTAKTPDGTRLGKWAARIDNPLLRSGLALAGANQGRNGDDDGVLTALEATALDLWGTKLVVLSACDTGVGEVKNGDGVYGLRRALFLAGTESQLMSLWPVSDRSTRDLMAGYYQALVQNAGRGEALRRVQLKMLRNKSRSHPYYWASFILAGEWANLKGQR